MLLLVHRMLSKTTSHTISMVSVSVLDAFWDLWDTLGSKKCLRLPSWEVLGSLGAQTRKKATLGEVFRAKGVTYLDPSFGNFLNKPVFLTCVLRVQIRGAL